MTCRRSYKSLSSLLIPFGIHSPLAPHQKPSGSNSNGQLAMKAREARAKQGCGKRHAHQIKKRKGASSKLPALSVTGVDGGEAKCCSDDDLKSAYYSSEFEHIGFIAVRCSLPFFGQAHKGAHDL